MSKKGKASAAEERAFLDNAISTLVANIRFAAVDTEIRSICITSSIPNEGKTTIAAGLAEALAAQGRRVLLVENDMQRRSMAGTLGVHARNGLYSVLMGQVSLQDAAVPTKTAGLYFLDCEPHIPNPSNVLASKRYRRFLEATRQTFDYVVIDTPPVSTFVDGAIVASIVDATLLVVRQNYTKRDEVVASIEQLRKADANVIGTVMNFVPAERNEYYYSYYTKDGKKVKKSRGADEGPKLQTSGGAAAVPVQSQQVRAAAGAQAAGQAAGQQQAIGTVGAAAGSAATPSAAAAAKQAAVAKQNAAVQPARTASRKPAPDSTEQFMINAGYLKGRNTKS